MQSPIGSQVAACRITAAGAFTAPRGVVRVNRIGQGLYAVELAAGWGVAERDGVPSTCSFTPGVSVTCLQTGDRTFTCTGSDSAGAAADADFGFALARVSVG